VDRQIEGFRPKEALAIIEPYFKITAINRSFPKTDYIALGIKYIEVLEFADQNSDVILESNLLKDKYKLTDSSLVKLHTTLARMYEKVADSTNTIRNLKMARKYLSNEFSDEIKSKWHIRMASYHRVFADKDSAMIYAKKALQYKGTEKGSAYFLIAFLDKDFDRKIENLQAATKILKSYDNHKAVSFMYLNLYEVYSAKGLMKIAKKYLDSSVTLSKPLAFFELKSTLSDIQSSYYENKNRLDSALFYKKEANYWAMKELELKSSDEIYFANRKYQNEKLTDSLGVVNIKLKSEAKISSMFKRKNNYKNILIFITVLFLSGTIVFLFFLYKNKKIIENDAKTINDTNKKLVQTIDYNLILEKELQHRIKNKIALIVSLISFQINEIEDHFYKNKLITLKSRINTIAMVYEKYLNKSNLNLGLNQSILESSKIIVYSLINIQKDQITYKYEIEDLFFPIEFMLPFGIMINELVSNTIKHAHAQGGKEISLEIHRNENILQVKYGDNGALFSTNSNQDEHLGMFIIKSMLAQLNGFYTREKSTYTITINLEV
jgi:two-component sensor histidine kinase